MGKVGSSEWKRNISEGMRRKWLERKRGKRSGAKSAARSGRDSTKNTKGNKTERDLGLVAIQVLGREVTPESLRVILEAAKASYRR